MTHRTPRRGWIEIYPDVDGSWSVYDWTEGHSSGGAHGSYPTRSEAVLAAARLAVTLNRKCFIVVDL